MKLRQILSKSLLMTLSASVAFAPITQSYAAADSSNATPTSKNQNSAALMQKISSTSEEVKAYVDTALYYIKKNQLDKGLQYLNGAAAAGNKLDVDNKDKYMQLRIGEAIAQAPQQLPDGTPAGPVVIPPLPVVPFDVPATTTTTPTPTTTGTGDFNSDDSQIRALNELMKKNPQLRSLLWQVAMERTSTTSSDIGNNPGFYAAGPPVIASHAMCSQSYYLCAILTGGGILDVDYTGQIMALKNRDFGIPLDTLAQDIIKNHVLIATMSGVIAPLLAGFVKAPTYPQQWGSALIDLSPSIIIYGAVYSAIGQLAPLWNYPLDAGTKEPFAILALACAGYYSPIFKAAKTTGAKLGLLKRIENEPALKQITQTVAKKATGKDRMKALAQLIRTNPNIRSFIENGLAAFGRRMTPTTKKTFSASEMDPKNINQVVDTNTPAPADPGGINPNPTNPAPFPNPQPGPTDPNQPPPTNDGPISRGARIMQAVQLAGQMGLGGLKALTEAELGIQFANLIFKRSYIEDRRLQGVKFQTFLKSGANTKFLKLLVLSQKPEALVVSNPVPPVIPGAFPGATNPGTSTPPKPTDFPFDQKLKSVATTARTTTPIETFGGNPESFILNLARYLHFCSKQDVIDAASAANDVVHILNQHPSLVTWKEVREKVATGVSDQDDETNSRKPKLTLKQKYEKATVVKESVLEKIIPFYKAADHQENLKNLYDAGAISAADVKKILLAHDCYGRRDTDRYDDLKKEMITYSVFSDADMAVLRATDVFVRLRMAELICQLIYLNGKPSDQIWSYFEKVKIILGLTDPAYATYFQTYQATLETQMYVPYILSPTGYRLRNLPSNNPYDSNVMEERRPDEPQLMTPVQRVIPVNQNNGGFGGYGGFGSGGFGSTTDTGFGNGTTTGTNAIPFSEQNPN